MLCVCETSSDITQMTSCHHMTHVDMIVAGMHRATTLRVTSQRNGTTQHAKVALKGGHYLSMSTSEPLTQSA